ncbi:MAG TPA: phage Gp37/Gp68 family protein [Anaerolineaceae bacterium]|nr:phage Gp37/Gp68 family protein [Anaerolineaceae bacterium]
MGNTQIEWADKVWNPVTGCTPVSAGCAHCYAERIAKRFWKDRPFSKVMCHEDRLDDPLRWKKPARVFVNSMSDLFHPDVPALFTHRVFQTMLKCPQHTFMILTKRPGEMIQYVPVFPLGNVWLGVSVEDQKTADERIPLLLQTPAAVRFVSCEPMLGPVNLTNLYGHIQIGEHVDLCVNALAGKYAPAWAGRKTRTDKSLAELYAGKLDWVICGGESGPGARPMHPDWVMGLRDQCTSADVPFFFKQWGEWHPRHKNEFETVCQVCGCSDERACEGGCYWVSCELCSKCENIAAHIFEDNNVVYHVGKKRAGRLLDSQVWAQFPEVKHD